MDESQNNVTSQELQSDEVTFDAQLRPQAFSEYVGQDKIKNSLSVFIQAAKQRGEPLEHVLLSGPPGLGKTTLAHIIAKEIGTSIRVTSGPALERAGDLAAILTNLSEGDILFIDEIHRLPKTIAESLYPAMEDFALDIVLGKGPAARTIRLDVPKFTLIGATTRMSSLSAPLRDRFGNLFHLDFYTDNDVVRILRRSAKILSIALDENAAQTLANRSRYTPRIANRILKRVRDYAQVKSDGIITPEVTHEALHALGIDGVGLDDLDRKILQTIIEKFSGGPVGLYTIAASLAEEMQTIEDVYEPYLMRMGFLHRTSRGRVATERAYEHLGIAYKFQAKNLFN
ncbi:Holliday junction branch migration DNA helicase RuvB [Candidatus Uhrbacteria bacterium]|nr:Holliday junction branch migration DNA helicase RuvB [Candidatus Uhrbacteria bacterium]